VARRRVGGDVTPRGRRLAVAAAAAIAAAACSKVGVPTSSPPAGNAWTIPGTVRISDNQEPNTLIKMFSNQATADDVTALLFEPLFRFDDREKPVPALATVFPSQANGLISKDGLRITFDLRPGVRWSDGAPVTAGDLIYTWHAIVDGANPVTTTAGYDDIRSMAADGPHRVTMVLKRPFGPAVYLFSEGSFPPLPAHLLSRFSRIDRLPYDSAPVGDGPFELRQWIHGSDLIFVPDPYYWRGKPHLSEIDMRIIPDSVTQVSSLKTHEIDVLDGVAKDLTGQIAAIPGVTVVRQLSADYRHLDFNTRNPLLADVAVRRAVAMSIDFDRVIKTVYAGLGVRAATTIPPMSWARDDVKALPFDPAAAAASLDADGFVRGPDGIRSKDGRRLALTISTATENLANQNAELLVADELRRVGIEVTTKNYATAVLFAPDGPLYGGRYDMAWVVDTEGVDPDILGSIGCDYFPPRGANTTFFCDPRVDAALHDAEISYDRPARARDYALAAKLLVDDAPFVPVYWDVSVTAYNDDLNGFRPSPVITDFWNAWDWNI
jgi:peptide/nickel transport system substrate-binding protein